MEENLLDVADRWVWFPANLTVIEEPEFTLTLNTQDTTDNVVHVSRTANPAALLSHIEHLVKEAGGRQLKWWVLATSRPREMHAILSEHGYSPSEIVEVLAWSLGDSTKPRLPWPTVALTHVDRPQMADDVIAAVTVLATVFNGAAPSSDELNRAVQDWSRDSASASGYYIARNPQKQIVGAAGLTMNGSVGKFWGSAVQPAWRTQGLYRQLVKLRAQVARNHGANHCLVKARIGTSAPILRQAGFLHLATEVCYRRPLA